MGRLGGFVCGLASFFILATYILCSAQNLDLELRSKNQIAKIDGTLNDVYEAWRSGHQTQVRKKAAVYGLKSSTPDHVVVILEPSPGELANSIDRNALTHLDATVLAESQHLMRISVPIRSLPDLVDIPGVSFVRKPMRPSYNRTTSEGVALTGVQRAFQAGIQGKGVKVGVIDSGFKNAPAARDNGDLPSTWRYMDYTDEGIYTGDEVHGTACAEIIYDVAPEAELLLIRTGDFVDFENAKDLAIREGVDILSYSGSWLGLGFGDGLGRACDVVNDAFDNGILWVNSAGNYAKSQHSSFFADSDSDGWHGFDGKEDEVLTLVDVDPGETVEIWLTWNEWPRTSQNYDLAFVKVKTDGSVEVMETSETVQFISSPVEHIAFEVQEAGTYGVAVWKTSTARSNLIKILSENHDFEDHVSISGTIGIPADSRGALAVAAISHRNWSFGPQEEFSSQGPTVDSRTKPDLSGPDRVSTYSYGLNGFPGTSAAAPHVAGIAALIKSQDTAYYTAERLRDLLFENAVDLGAPGKDNVYGYGRVDLNSFTFQARLPSVSLSPRSIDFGSVAEGDSLSRSFSISNQGQSTLYLETWTQSNPNFVVTSSSGGQVNIYPFDDEGDLQEWQTSSRGIHSITEGKFVIEGNESGFISSASPSLWFTNDLDISFDTEWKSGVDNSEYGIIFRSSNDGTYRFGISGNGAYTAYKVINGQFTDLIDWTFDPIVQSRGTNQLRVVSAGDSLRFWINQKMMFGTRDSDLTEGGIWLYIGGEQTVAFDNLAAIETPFKLRHAIQPGASENLNVLFKPLQADTYQGNIAIRTNDPNNKAIQISFAGRGIQALTPVIRLPSSTVNFADVVKVGSRGEQSVEIQNVGQGVLEISDIVSSNASVSVELRTATVNPGASIRVNIVFQPSAEGPFRATVTIKSNDRNSPDTNIDIRAEVPEGTGDGGDTTVKAGDFDGDNHVGFSDFLLFAGKYGSRAGDGRYQAIFDLNSDGTVNFSDFAIFTRNYED